MRVAALYRYPAKGFTPESCETLSLVGGGRIAGDRVLGAGEHARAGARGELIVGERLDDGGRKRMAAAIERYVLELPENPLSSHPERLPWRVAGDGVTPSKAPRLGPSNDGSAGPFA